MQLPQPLFNRHLAAGLLGKNAPRPFKKDSLSQELEWDMRDDAGKLRRSALREERIPK